MDIERIKKQLKLPELNDYTVIELALSDTTYLNHKSGQLPEKKKSMIDQHNRLAHLGDSIMNAAVVDYLYRTYPYADAGHLTNVGQTLKGRGGADAYARTLGLDQPGMCNLADGDDPDNRDRLYAELFEALIGALYIARNRDFEIVRDWFHSQCGAVMQQLVDGRL